MDSRIICDFKYFLFLFLREKVVFKAKSLNPPFLIKEITAEIGENLGKVLQNNHIPLPFTCGGKCECGTCAIRFRSRKEFMAIGIVQPIGSEEVTVLNKEEKSNL